MSLASYQLLHSAMLKLETNNARFSNAMQRYYIYFKLQNILLPNNIIPWFININQLSGLPKGAFRGVVAEKRMCRGRGGMMVG